MGQRLIISIVKDRKRIATIYYHWGAYSASSFETAKTIIDMVNGKASHQDSFNVKTMGFDEHTYVDKDSNADIRLRLIRMLESFHGGVTLNEDDRAYVKKLFPGEMFSDDVDRNNGLISFTGEQMEEDDNWAEGSLTIDLDQKAITDINVFWNYESYTDFYNEQVDFYNEQVSNESDDIPEENKIFKSKLNYDVMPFDELDKAIEETSENGYIQTANGEILGMIA